MSSCAENSTTAVGTLPLLFFTTTTRYLHALFVLFFYCSSIYCTSTLPTTTAVVGGYGAWPYRAMPHRLVETINTRTMMGPVGQSLLPGITHRQVNIYHQSVTAAVGPEAHTATSRHILRCPEYICIYFDFQRFECEFYSCFATWSHVFQWQHNIIHADTGLNAGLHKMGQFGPRGTRAQARRTPTKCYTKCGS